MTGIPAPSLRNWEKRYGFPMPERTDSGHRFYCARDVEFLKKASQLIEQGHPLLELANLYKQFREQASALNLSPNIANVTDDVSYRVELLYNSLIKFDHIGTQQHYGILNAKLGPDQLFDRVFEYILRRMGAEWVDGKINIAQEHYASSFVRLKLASFLGLELPVTSSQRILAATLTDERHEGGLMLVAAHLKFKGYRVDYFGVDLPMKDLILITQEIKPSVITLSYLHFSRLEADLMDLNQFEIPVIVGGIALFDSEKVNKIRPLAKSHIHFCHEKVGSQAAHFVELICQSK